MADETKGCEDDQHQQHWVKVTNAAACHNGVQYVEGEWVKDPLPWNGRGCGPGGLHFARLPDIHLWLWTCGVSGDAVWLWDVEVADDAPFADFGDKAKAHCIRLTNKRPVPEWVYLVAIQCNYEALQYVPTKNRTHAMCVAALTAHVNAIQWVPQAQLSHDLCMAMVHRHSSMLRYVPEDMRSALMCRLAVQKN